MENQAGENGVRPACLEEGCKKHAHTRGRCSTHYNYWRFAHIAAGTWEAQRIGKGWHGDSERKRVAGRLGGLSVATDRNRMVELGRKGGQALSANREHMVEMGRKGGITTASDRDHMRKIGRLGGMSKGAGKGVHETTVHEEREQPRHPEG